MTSVPPRDDDSAGTKKRRYSGVRYLLAGGLAFLVDLGLLALLHEVFGWPTWLAAGTAFVISFVFTYSIQRYFTFGSQEPHGRALLKYSLLVAFNTVATAGIVALIDLTPAGWAMGKIASTAAMTIWNYFAYRYWVFADRSR
ncbi:GtrA family protein [Microbacterium phyllosphaerae]|uniref:GtrA family protein n=1 Tax=Microbacterium phyllosphaerae TaxID=124798 RepID=UPI003D654ED6